MNIIVQEKQEIGQLLDFLHDRPLSLDKFEYNQERKKLCFSVPIVTEDIVKKRKYLFVSVWENPVCEAQFCIYNVEKYEIVDNAEVGEAVVDAITYRDGLLMISCCIPVDISIAVSSLLLKLKVSDTVVDSVRRFSL